MFLCVCVCVLKACCIWLHDFPSGTPIITPPGDMSCLLAGPSPRPGISPSMMLTSGFGMGFKNKRCPFNLRTSFLSGHLLRERAAPFYRCMCKRRCQSSQAFSCFVAYTKRLLLDEELSCTVLGCRQHAFMLSLLLLDLRPRNRVDHLQRV